MKSENLYKLIWMSRPLMQVAETHVERHLAGTKLTVRMRAVLEILERQGPLSVPDIAHHLYIQRQYVQLMVNETLSEGLTEKKPNPRHQRSSLIALTEKGAGLIDDVLKRENAFVQELADGFDAEEVRIAFETTQKLLQKLQEREAGQ